MLSIRMACVLCLLACVSVAAQDGPNPSAPTETEQFAFMVGEWSCTTKGLQQDGTYTAPGTAKWKAWFILDGWAIQDEWISNQPSGSVFKGTNIRSYNPKIGKWECRWLPMGSLQWRHFVAEKVGGTVVMTMVSPERDASGLYIDRNTFHNISKSSWSWRKDRSYDGGKTWTEGIFLIEAVRVK